MKTQSPDTSFEAERFLIARLREMPSWEKARQAAELTRTCQMLALSGIRRRYPAALEKECRLRLAALWLDRETMMKVFHWDPEKKGL